MGKQSPSGAGDRARGDTLGLRLALAFLGVSVAAIVLMAVLTGFLSARDVSSLADRQQSQLAGAAAVSAGSAWEHSGSWASADLAPVLSFAQGIGIALQIRDTAGRVVAATRGFVTVTGTEVTEPVVVDGQAQGVTVARFTGTGIGGADRALRGTLLQAIAGTAGLAALLALVGGVTVAPGVTRPTTRLV